jgi:hypothetical protein
LTQILLYADDIMIVEHYQLWRKPFGF